MSTKVRRKICDNCGWHWFAHRNKNQCPNMPRNPDGSKSRFKLRLPTPEQQEKRSDRS